MKQTSKLVLNKIEPVHFLLELVRTGSNIVRLVQFYKLNQIFGFGSIQSIYYHKSKHDQAYLLVTFNYDNNRIPHHPTSPPPYSLTSFTKEKKYNLSAMKL